MGTVISIHRAASKGAQAEPLAEATVVKNFGIEGDYRSRKGRGRQITMIEEESLEFVAKTLKLEKVPDGASRRQIVVRGINLNDTIGKRLRIGSVLLEVHAPCDPCSNMEKTIARGARWAMKDRGGICAKVIEGGTIKVGDSISVAE